jgi:predicted nuclease with TOPRIM domain
MRAIRTENLRQVKDISALTEKANEAKRKLELAEASEAALKTQLKSAEAAARGLKEEVIRTKALVAQARASCATEVRRRDRQIDSLKKQLGEAGRARGARPNPAITTIHVTGDVRSEKNTPTKGVSPSADGYSLRDETNAFLANLAANLSEENEAILTAMRHTMVQLREMSGFVSEESSGGHVVKQPGWDEMSAELDSVLEHMKTILTNPSFVPIEEVMLREEEIARLKDGWVKMEDRWKDAVLLIDTWRKRMAASGKPVDEDEMMMSLRLSPAKTRHDTDAAHYADFGLSAVVEENEEESMMQREASPCPSNPESLHLVPAEAYRGHAEDYVDSSAELSAAEDDVPLEEYDVEEPNFEVLQESTAQPDLNDSLDSSPLPEPPQLSPLRNSSTAGNRGAVRNPKMRKPQIDFTTITEEKTRDIAPPVELLKPALGRPKLQPSSTVTQSETAVENEEGQRNFSTSSLDEALLVKTSVDTEPERSQSQEHHGLKHTPRRGPSRLPLPRNAEPQQSPLTMATIAAKLAASEKEADAARVRAKLRAARAARTTQKPTLEVPKAKEQAVEDDKQADVDPVKNVVVAGEDQHRPEGEEEAQPKPEKRKRERRTSKAASRRRSTLSPLELQGLISGTVA